MWAPEISESLTPPIHVSPLSTPAMYRIRLPSPHFLTDASTLNYTPVSEADSSGSPPSSASPSRDRARSGLLPNLLHSTCALHFRLGTALVFCAPPPSYLHFALVLRRPFLSTGYLSLALFHPPTSRPCRSLQSFLATAERRAAHANQTRSPPSLDNNTSYGAPRFVAFIVVQSYVVTFHRPLSLSLSDGGALRVVDFTALLVPSTGWFDFLCYAPPSPSLTLIFLRIYTQTLAHPLGRRSCLFRAHFYFVTNSVTTPVRCVTRRQNVSAHSPVVGRMEDLPIAPARIRSVAYGRGMHLS